MWARAVAGTSQQGQDNHFLRKFPVFLIFEASTWGIDYNWIYVDTAIHHLFLDETGESYF
jgi:hypothetical protein